MHAGGPARRPGHTPRPVGPGVAHHFRWFHPLSRAHRSSPGEHTSIPTLSGVPGAPSALRTARNAGSRCAFNARRARCRSPAPPQGALERSSLLFDADEVVDVERRAVLASDRLGVAPRDRPGARPGSRVRDGPTTSAEMPFRSMRAIGLPPGRSLGFLADALATASAGTSTSLQTLSRRLSGRTDATVAMTPAQERDPRDRSPRSTPPRPRFTPRRPAGMGSEPRPRHRRA